MRRKEFIPENTQEIEEFLNEMSFGFLGTTDENGFPHITPLNYLFYDGHVYFHGSRIGDKMSQLTKQPHVSFAVAKEYAIIPSYFTDPKLACPATTFFKSVLLKGTAGLVTELDEKAKILEAFMQKLQPEGNYDPITPCDPAYIPQLKAVSVVKITVQHISAKFKFGQNAKGEKREKIERGLSERNLTHDPETLSLMEKYCPYHNKTD